MKTAARSINTRRTQCERSLRRFQAFAWIRQAISPLNTDSPILFFTIPARAKGVAPWDEHVRTVEWCHPEYYVRYGGPLANEVANFPVISTEETMARIAAGGREPDEQGSA